MAVCMLNVKLNSMCRQAGCETTVCSNQFKEMHAGKESMLKNAAKQYEMHKPTPCTSRSVTKISGNTASYHHAPYVPVELKQKSVDRPRAKHNKNGLKLAPCIICSSRNTIKIRQLNLPQSNNVHQQVTPKINRRSNREIYSTSTNAAVRVWYTVVSSDHESRTRRTGQNNEQGNGSK